MPQHAQRRLQGQTEGASWIMSMLLGPFQSMALGHVRCTLLMHCCMKQAGPAALAPNVGDSRTSLARFTSGLLVCLEASA
jgi:hypothetical protein